MQYTIRNVPDYLDAALRKAAREQGSSLNEAAVLALVRGAGLSEGPRRKRDLADVAGSWREDPAFDSALAAQHAIDDSIWPARKEPQGQKRLRGKTAASTQARQKRMRGGAAA